MPRRSPLPAALTRAPFLVRDALALGVSRDVLRSARFRRPFHGVRVPAHLPDSLELRCQAAALLVPEAAFSHGTAAALLRLPLPVGRAAAPGEAAVVSLPAGREPRRESLHGRPGPLHVTMAVTPRRTARRHPVGLVCHVCKLAPRECERRPDGLLLTSAARTWADLAARLSLVDLVVVADAALRRGLVTTAQLATTVETWSTRPGAALLRRALPLVEPRTDSPMETRLRLLLVLAGLPQPVAGRDVALTGAWIARPDLSYPELRIAIEYDGDHHRVDRQQWQSDIYRRRLLEEAGWLVLVFTADDVLRRPDETVRRVRSALQSRRRAA
ncbi:MAG TPA: DUF559 domain-containing protein [Actinomycetales bacterium]|nr:DUF559 domain-containing protein [Actinomycetales bacterium]